MTPEFVTIEGHKLHIDRQLAFGQVRGLSQERRDARMQDLMSLPPVGLIQLKCWKDQGVAFSLPFSLLFKIGHCSVFISL